MLGCGVITTPLVGWIVFADRNPIFQSGDVVCGGELFTLHHTTGTVVVVDAGVPLLLNVFRDGKSTGSFNEGLPGSYATKGLCVGLQPASRGYAFIVPANDRTSWIVKLVADCKGAETTNP